MPRCLLTRHFCSVFVTVVSDPAAPPDTNGHALHLCDEFRFASIITVRLLDKSLPAAGTAVASHRAIRALFDGKMFVKEDT